MDYSSAIWTKSSRSVEGSYCVETANLGHVMAVRDSKAPDSAVCEYSAEQWARFVAMVRGG